MGVTTLARVNCYVADQILSFFHMRLPPIELFNQTAIRLFKQWTPNKQQMLLVFFRMEIKMFGVISRVNQTFFLNDSFSSIDFYFIFSLR